MKQTLVARLAECLVTYGADAVTCVLGFFGCRGPAAEGIVVHMFTYGAPRVGNKVWCTAVAQGWLLCDLSES